MAWRRWSRMGTRRLPRCARGLVPPAVGAAGGMADLGGFFGLHPAMPQAAAMYHAGELLPVHAVAGHYRSRSHFEAQDYMERRRRPAHDQRLAEPRRAGDG